MPLRVLHRPDQIPDSLRDDLFILDDFYEDPDAVRRLALRAEYQDFGAEANFPGVESVKAFYSSAHAERLASAVGADISFDPARWVFGKFRISTEKDRPATWVHLDRIDWSAIVYLSPELSPEAAGRGSLGIYWSREFGSVRVPDDAELRSRGYRNRDEFDSRFVVPRSLDTGSWDLEFSIPTRYNRCIILRGSEYFHGITDRFGISPETGRLTQNFFFWDQRNRCYFSEAP